MTICMGAICKDSAGESGRAVVVASDRIVTWAQLTRFEQRVPKFHVMGPTIVGLAAGDALVGTRLIEDVRPIAATATAVADVAEALSNQFAAIRIRSAEADVLRPHVRSLETVDRMHRSSM